MRTQINRSFLVAVLVLVLTVPLFVTASPTVEALTSKTIDSLVLTGKTINSNVTVGVIAGDWMEYNVTYIGAADPPEDYPTWFRFHITDVQGTKITAEKRAKAVNGEVSTFSYTYDLKEGVLQLLVIPAGLTYADVFYNKDYGNITIAGTEAGTYVGKTRTAVHAVFNGAEAYWDKYTGVFLYSEQDLEIDNETVAQQVTMSANNIWQTQITPTDYSGLDPNLVNGIALIAVFVVGAIAFLLIRRKYSKK